MRHYALDQWVDFTRGLAALEERARMAEHLGAGCDRCQREADFCAQVNYVCERLDTQQVPESVTHMARAIFPFRGPERPTRGTRLPIELIFDSFLVPAPAGFRATWQVGWQGLYRAGDCSIDLRIEPELKSTRAAVIGQISNHVLPKVEMSNLPVSLRSGKQVVAETLSNRFGEFQMEYEQQARLKLCICLKDGSNVKDGSSVKDGSKKDGSRNIQVPLKRFTSEKPAATHRAPRRKRATTEPQ